MKNVLGHICFLTMITIDHVHDPGSRRRCRLWRRRARRRKDNCWRCTNRGSYLGEYYHDHRDDDDDDYDDEVTVTMMMMMMKQMT